MDALTTQGPRSLWTKYTGKYAPLDEGFTPVRAPKRQRQATGSVGGESPQGYMAMSFNSLKEMSQDEKLNMLMEGMLTLNQMHMRI